MPHYQALGRKTLVSILVDIFQFINHTGFVKFYRPISFSIYLLEFERAGYIFFLRERQDKMFLDSLNFCTL